ncbi:tryptophan-rich sensory protein [Aquidulcibacter sp.]|uniref:tryptophan-rich sensory protein n=1 Tax=Aquidulcibacter sp. TaxID=2052990 RepID=UPI0025BAFBBD|nr:tryptophan-rich sensory protein [Aquidulcibacter sp.]
MLAKIVTPVSLGALGGMAIAIVTNALIFSLGYGEGGQEVTDREAGPINTLIFAIVPFVWLFLFAAMGAAIMKIRMATGEFGLGGVLIFVLMLNCALYPIYTLGFSSSDAGLFGNYATALLAVFIIAWVWPIEKTAALLIVPIPIWVTLASIGLYANETGRAF